MKYLLVKDLLWELNSKHCSKVQKRPEYVDWVGFNIPGMVDEFVNENKLTDSYFIKIMNKAFRTSRFELLLKKWIVNYLWDFLSVVDDFSQLNKELVLEDAPVNRFGIQKYYSKFGIAPKIKWERRANLLQRVFSILAQGLKIFYLSFDKGLTISLKKKKYKVMREAVWGLYDFDGYYFHDDFLVDNDNIRKEDLLLFSRGISSEEGRLKGYNDAKKSPYAHFDISDLPLGIMAFLLRVIPKYIIAGGYGLFKELSSANFSLYWSIYSSFIYNALLYEKLFCHFEIISELGHNYCSISHVPESIVCQNYGTMYYLMHWSDNSLKINRFATSFLSCDGFFIWGKSHIQRDEEDPRIFKVTGYVFKRFIKETVSRRTQILTDLGIKPESKVISFFDESFGERCKMTEWHYVNFWQTALKFAEINKNVSVIIKSKGHQEDRLSEPLRKRFIDIKNKINSLENIHIFDGQRWSFIEIIGVSDIVVSQGMTSSSAIAIVCGIEGLYMDQAGYDHIFSRHFKDRIVFDDTERLLSMARKILSGADSPLKDIPEDMLRGLDKYPDDRGIDLFRDILLGKTQKRTGIIIQARMGSTRLPGKVMMPILNKPILEILIERLKSCKNMDLLAIATTINKNDDVIDALACKLKVKCFRGDEEDVLNRYYKAAKKYSLDVVVRITSDCPLMDPYLVDDVIAFYLENPQVDYASNTINRTYPRGFDIEVFSFQSLKKAAEEAVKPYQREHVTPFIYENMKTLNYENRKDASRYRVTVDTREDFELVAYIYELLSRGGEFGCKEVVDLLDSRPDLVLINQRIKQKQI